jgi:hypothetical protein
MRQAREKRRIGSVALAAPSPARPPARVGDPGLRWWLLAKEAAFALLALFRRTKSCGPKSGADRCDCDERRFLAAMRAAFC